jgi:hypothetical protein
VKVLRTEARALLAEIVGTARDPLLIAIGIAEDENQPTPLRLEAALGACRYLHPVLSAASVDHRHLHAKVDAAALVDRLNDRIARLSTAPVVDLEVTPA